MKDKKGFIIAVALTVAATLSVMIAAFSMSILYRNQNGIRHVNSIKAYYLAQAGIEYGRLTEKGGVIPLGAADTATISCDHAAGPITPIGMTADISRDGWVRETSSAITPYYGTKIGDAGYNPLADLNKDGIINTDDSAIMTANSMFTGAANTSAAAQEGYLLTIRSTATVNNVTRTLVCQEESNRFTRSIFIKRPVVKWR